MMGSSDQGKMPIAALVFGGKLAAFGLSMGFCWLFRQRSKEVKENERRIAIQILKEIRKYLDPILRGIQASSRALQSKIRKLGMKSPASQPASQEELPGESPDLEFRARVLELEETIYARYGIDDKEAFEALCIALKKNDLEVAEIMKEMETLYAQAKRGETLIYSFEIPKTISEADVLLAQKQIFKMSMKFRVQDLKRYREGYECNSREEKIEREKIISEEKLKILEHFGFDVMEEYLPETVFLQAIARLRRESPEFRIKIQLLNEFTDHIMAEVNRGRKSEAELSKEIDEIDSFILTGKDSSLSSKSKVKESMDRAGSFDSKTEASETRSIEQHFSPMILNTKQLQISEIEEEKSQEGLKTDKEEDVEVCLIQEDREVEKSI